MSFTQLFYTKNNVLFPELDTLTGIDQTQTLQNQVGQFAQGTLTQANLIAIHTTPLVLIPSPGVGYAIIVDEVRFKHNYAVAAYTGGGDVTLNYTTSATAIIDFDVTLVTNASSTSRVGQPTIYGLDASTGTVIGFDIGTQGNNSVSITNAAAVFAAGDVTNTVDYIVKYRVVGV